MAAALGWLTRGSRERNRNLSFRFFVSKHIQGGSYQEPMDVRKSMKNLRKDVDKLMSYYSASPNDGEEVTETNDSV